MRTIFISLFELNSIHDKEGQAHYIRSLEPISILPVFSIYPVDQKYCEQAVDISISLTSASH